MKKKLLILNIYRLVVQILFVILLPYLVTLTFDGIRAIYVAIIHNEFNFQILFPKIICVLAIVPFTMLFGRFFCGWMCAFGALGDFAHTLSVKIFKTKTSINSKVDFYLKFLKYVVLGYCVVLIWTFGIKTLNVLSPWDAFGQLPDFGLAYSTFQIGFIVFVVVLVASFFYERFFCRYICPLGAFFSLTTTLRILKINKPSDGCGKCKICTKNCPMGIPMYSKDVISSGECIECMNCTQVCPRSNVKLGKDAKPFLVSALTVLTITGAKYGLDSAKNLDYFTKINTPISIVPPKAGGATSQSQIYNDGTYTGTAAGYRPGLNVTVKIQNGMIVDIKIGANNEEPGYREQPFSVIPQEIISAQSTKNIAVVSGATYSSNGVINAVANALSKALKDKTAAQNMVVQATQSPENNRSSDNLNKSNPSVSNVSVKAGKYKNGVYTASAMGFEGKIKVAVTILKNKITKILIKSQSESRPRTALKEIPKRILKAQSTNISVVSGATYTSNGIKNAVASALNKAKGSSTNTTKLSATEKPTILKTSNNKPATTNTSNSNYKDGTYAGSAMGFEGNIDLNVKVVDGKISSVIITSEKESKPKTALTEVPNRIVQAQSTNVSVVSGATYTSNGVKKAAANALSKATIKTDTNSTQAPEPSQGNDNPVPEITKSPIPTNVSGYKDGTYTGSANGYEGAISVTVKVVSNKISSVTITSEKESKPKTALSDIPNRIVQAQTPNVSVVSGATYTSIGIINAVVDALKNAKADGSVSTPVPTATKRPHHDDDDDEKDDD